MSEGGTAGRPTAGPDGPGLRRFCADLHIHTALSPCGSDEMTPAAIVAAALAKGLDMIAVCDHNTAGNVRAVQRAAEAAGGGLAVIAGMELTSAEEVHVVGLFPDAAAAERAAAQVRALLPQADAGYYSFFGEQPVCWRATAPGGVRDGRSGARHPPRPDGGGGSDPPRRRASPSRPTWTASRSAFFRNSDSSLKMQASTGSRCPSGCPRIHRGSAEFAALGLPLVCSSDSHYLEEIGAGQHRVLPGGAHLRANWFSPWRARKDGAYPGEGRGRCMTSPSICSRYSRTPPARERPGWT